MHLLYAPLLRTSSAHLLCAPPLPQGGARHGDDTVSRPPLQEQTQKAARRQRRAGGHHCAPPGAGETRVCAVG